MSDTLTVRRFVERFLCKETFEGLYIENGGINTFGTIVLCTKSVLVIINKNDPGAHSHTHIRRNSFSKILNGTQLFSSYIEDSKKIIKKIRTFVSVLISFLKLS